MKLSNHLKKGFLALGSILGTLLVLEGLSAVFLMVGFQYKPVDIPDRLGPPAPTLPYEIPASLDGFPRYKAERTLNWSDLGPGARVVSDGNYDLPGIPLRLKPNHSAQVKSYDESSGRLIYNYRLTTDAAGRRISQSSSEKRRSARHLVMMGCSYTFGTGVNDSETITWHINALQDATEAYNGGHGGFGTSDVLARLMSPDELQDLRQKRGILIYNFIANHVHRSFGSTASPWTNLLSDVELLPDGHFALRGDFDTSRPRLMAFYRFFSGLHFVRLFGLHLPVLRHHHYDLIAKMISEARHLYRLQTLPENELVVALYPQSVDGVDVAELRRALSRHKIPFIDYSGLNLARFIKEPARIPYDGHPNGHAHAFYAKLLLKDLADWIAPPAP